MPNVWETFTDSYLKKLKRPELQGIFNPDQSYGANMLFRSEETNPWAGRDQSNAKFGPMGARGGITTQAPTMSPQGAGSLLPQGWNLPMMPSPQQDTFHQLMGGIQGPVSAIGSKYGADAIMDWMKSSPKEEAAKALMEAKDSAAMLKELLAGPYDAAAGVGPYGEAAEGMTEALGGASDVAGGAAPFASAGLKLGIDALTGKLQKHPAGSVGSAAGGLAGAAAGTAVFPGVGTVLGGLLGSLFGSQGGNLLERWFGW